MKTIISFLTIIVLAGLEVQAGDSPSTPNPPPPSFKPTWKGDDHDQPVYTSLTNGPAFNNNWANTNIVPAITNWPATNLPPMTNWPAMTNPPASQPPGGQ